MHKLITFGAISVLLALVALPAAATVAKTWVSSSGTDSGTCQLVAPCKTFQFAHDQTSPGGEIDVKDTGSYGGLTITKGISIVSGDGALAAIGAPSGGTAITVAAGPQEKVVLEGLFIDGHGTGANGIVFNSAYSLTIENCHVRNVTQFAITLQPNGATLFNVVNTEVASAGEVGIIVQPATPVNGVISGVFAHDSTTGVEVAGSSNTSLVNSVISGNNYGIRSLSPANVLIGQTTVSENKTFGIQRQSGLIQSYGDNYINANGTDIEGAVSSIQRR